MNGLLEVSLDTSKSPILRARHARKIGILNSRSPFSANRIALPTHNNLPEQ
jgi:hypothetical protein